MPTSPETIQQTTEPEQNFTKLQESTRIKEVLQRGRQYLGRAVLAVTLAAGFTATTEITEPELAAAETGGYPDWNKACITPGINYGKTSGTGYWCADYSWGDVGNPNYNSPRGYAYRNCTDWAAYRIAQMTGISVPWGLGNGGKWDDNAPSKGLIVDKTPEPGDAAVWNGSNYGHVEVVESVNPDGSINTSGYNKKSDGNYNTQSGVRADWYVDFNGTGIGANGTPIGDTQTQGDKVGGPETIGVYDPIRSIFFERDSNTSGPADITKAYGNSNWVPLSGDWNNDGVDTPGVYDPSTGRFHLSNSNVPGGPADVPSFTYGNIGWIPIVGDWNGNGYSSIGMYDPNTATFYLRNSNSSGNADYTFQFGNIGWKPVTGDWDGMDDGNRATSVGAYNPSNATFYLNNEADSSPAEYTIPFGNIGWIPIAGDWNGNGFSTIGAYSPNNATFYLKNSHSSGGADITAQYGNVGWKPVTGDWNGK